jgi:ribosome biogenesis GTPase A
MKEVVKELYDIWEPDGSFYEMIQECYEKNPDPNLLVYKKAECEEEDVQGDYEASECNGYDAVNGEEEEDYLVLVLMG